MLSAYCVWCALHGVGTLVSHCAFLLLLTARQLLTNVFVTLKDITSCLQGRKTHQKIDVQSFACFSAPFVNLFTASTPAIACDNTNEGSRSADGSKHLYS